MKNTVLRFIYSKYRSHFYGFFVQEMIGDVPQKIEEPALTFLANGKDKLEQWCLYWVHLIQMRIVTDKKDIETQQGMILMLKIFLSLVRKQTPARVVTKGKVEEPKEDFAAKVEEDIRKFRERK